MGTTTCSSSIRVLPLLVFCLGSVYRLELSRYLNTSNDKSFLPPSEIKYHHNGDTGSLLPSPACRPHYQVALPNGEWTNSTKFRRLYFYHVRKAGVRFFTLFLSIHSALSLPDELMKKILFRLGSFRGQLCGGTLKKLQRTMDSNTKRKSTGWRKIPAPMMTLRYM